MEKIQIKCTSCGQKFSVTESYIGKMVECGGCDEKFKVEGAALIKQKKHYPGEKSGTNAELFSKSPANIPAQNQNVGFETASYQNVSAEYAQPAKPLKTLMICVGAIFILLFITLFLIGGREGGFLKGLDDSKRLILAAFVALAGSALIIIGSRHKSKGILLSLLLGGSLMAMPFVFPEVLEAPIINIPLTDSDLIDSADSDTEKASFAEQLENYKRNIGFEKVAESRKALADPDSLKVLILKETKVQYQETILAYLTYTLNLSTAPVTYGYGREVNGEPVTLITFVTDTPLEQVFEITKRFGKPQQMNEITTNLKVIEVVVDANTFKGSSSKLINDENHPRYFDANCLELKNIDRSRQLNAAKRLQSSVRKGRQSDIAAALSDLISNNDHQVSEQAIATLYHWTLPEYKTDQKVLDYAKKVVTTEHMHRSVMDYLADKNVVGSEKILAKQWASPTGHLLWENHLIRAKKKGETAVISTLPSIGKTHFKSAARILGKVGSTKSISAINALLPRVNEDTKKYLKAAIDEIKSRQ